MVVVVVSTTLSLASAGIRFTGQFQQLGRVEPKLSHKPRKYLGWLCKDGQQLLNNCKCFWQAPRSRNSMNFKPRDLPLHFAYGKEAEDISFSNVGENTDEMFDDLFKKYGKVVFKSNDQKPPSAEIDDDAESLSFCLFQVLVDFLSSEELKVAVAMAKVASDVKAADIKVLFVKPLVYWTRFFIIATAFSRPQIDAIGSRMRDLAEEKYGKVPSGDSKPNSWTLLDFGDVVVHIFLPQQRELYNLEEFYGNATAIELPFENQSPYRS